MKKRNVLILCFGVLIALLLFPTSTIGAEGGASKSGQRDTQAGFIKGDTLPETSDSTKQSNHKEESLVAKPVGRLPSTGEKIAAGVSCIGVLMLLVILIAYKINIKKVGKKR